MSFQRLKSGAVIVVTVAFWVQLFLLFDGGITIIDPCPSFELDLVDLPSPPDEKDPLVVDVEHVLKGYNAPEDGFRIDESSDDWIWSMGNGDLLRVNTETMTATIFAHTGEIHEDCGSYETENHCGRPLGLLKLPPEDHARYQRYFDGSDDKISSKSETPLFLVADAYKGLLLVSSGGTIVPLLTSVEDQPLYFANAMARAGNGIIYLSDSSSRFRRNQVLLENLESHSTGRIVSWNPDTGMSRVVAKNLPFPNGMVLRDNDQSMLVALTTRHKIVQIDLTTPGGGEPKLFTTLPGIPDNLHVAYSKEWKRSVLWVATATKSSPVTQFLNKHPWLRKTLAMLPRDILLKCFKRYGLLLALDPDTGKLIHAYQDPSGTTGYLAGIHFDELYAYIGSWKNQFLARIPREKLFSVTPELEDGNTQ